MSKFSTKKIVLLAMMIALQIVLARFLAFSTQKIRFSLDFIPIAMTAILYGPLEGALVAALGDVLGTLLFSTTGPINLGLTLNAFLIGITYGVFLHKKQGWVRILFAVSIKQLVFSLLLNTYWISALYKFSYIALLPSRAIQCSIMFPVEFVILFILCKNLTTIKDLAQ